ncbi:MAG: DUF177 domain-containing protein [Myxococcales bacterium]|nr:DUF177 domain-containing protein [Myxococcota bacterium]MDW8283822.1 DUF177 domain-containing protein [Myxococcales bacterium]
MTPLVYRLKDLQEHPEGIGVNVSLDRVFLSWALGGTEADPAASSAQLTGRLLFQGGNVLLQAELSGALACTCQRCLEPAAVSVQCRLHMVYVPQGSLIPDEAFVDPDDVDYGHHDRHEVDLSDIVREQLILSIPIQVLCHTDCRGLCPRCGIDRNVSSCTCKMDVFDSPFSVLRNLKL